MLPTGIIATNLGKVNFGELFFWPFHRNPNKDHAYLLDNSYLTSSKEQYLYDNLPVVSTFQPKRIDTLPLTMLSGPLVEHQ